jgi:hypothetical protein
MGFRKLWAVFMTPADYDSQRYRIEADAAIFQSDLIRSNVRMMAGVAVFWLNWG